MQGIVLHCGLQSPLMSALRLVVPIWIGGAHPHAQTMPSVSAYGGCAQGYHVSAGSYSMIDHAETNNQHSDSLQGPNVKPVTQSGSDARLNRVIRGQR